MKLEQLKGICLFCGRSSGTYDPSGPRFCCTKGLPREVQNSFGRTLGLYPTIYPVPAAWTRKYRPPAPEISVGADFFAISGRASSTSKKISSRTAQDDYEMLPYPLNPILLGLRCGNATIYNLDGLAANFDFEPGCIDVCDMATYLWSNTLKDPRSWAVINNALAYGIRHLGVWTAGNAGLSLAKLAYAVNTRLTPAERIKVYCYGLSTELTPDLVEPLKRFRPHVVRFPTHPSRPKIFLPEDALKRLNARLATEMQIAPNEYWDVSDGWDGVALHMYRLLGRQICLHLKPRYIVVPVGTGDIFFGLYLGRKDALAEREIRNTDCRLVAAIPYGSSVLDNYRSHHLEIQAIAPTDGVSRPVAPKLATTYTPLLLVMYSAFKDPSVLVMQVSREEQFTAGQILASEQSRPLAASEPSALLAFGALKALANRHQEEQGETGQLAACSVQANVVVINTGCGLLGRAERKFSDSYLGVASTG